MEIFDLERFITAQDFDLSYETALNEVKASWIQTEWIWYVFPQIQGLGHSEMSKRYAIVSLLEAKAYFEDSTLRKRLHEITEELLSQYRKAEDLFGSDDAMKVHSCMTIFDIVAPDSIFKQALKKYYDGKRCERTLEIVKAEKDYYEAGSAFRRNGVIGVDDRGFMEIGIVEAEQMSHEQRLGTVLDIISRGETMMHIVEYYLWWKDLSGCRLSDVESGVRSHLRRFFNILLKDNKDKELITDAVVILRRDVSKTTVFSVAKDFDDFYQKYRNNKGLQKVLDDCITHSLCKPIYKMEGRFYNRIQRPSYTPEQLSELKYDEVFVFGSNLLGKHGGGAARVARELFGAVMGQGVGLQGQSYAIPTMQGGVETIRPYVDDFIAFAKEHTELFFYVTRIGCGIAGFKDEEMAPLFKDAQQLENVCLPESFIKY